jgi:hypothetical protein
MSATFCFAPLIVTAPRAILRNVGARSETGGDGRDGAGRQKVRNQWSRARKPSGSGEGIPDDAGIAGRERTGRRLEVATGARPGARS